MAFCRCIRSIQLVHVVQKCMPISQKLNFLKPDYISVIPDRSMRRGWAGFQMVMKRRRKAAGPAPIRKRSEWLEWNYQAELFSFPKRLQEKISESTLRIAFTNKSYLVEEERKRTELGVPLQDVPLNLTPNDNLVQEGETIMSTYIKQFLRFCYDNLPENGISAVHDHLMSEDVLAHVASNIGTSELILTAEYPVEKKTLAATFKAIVGAIAIDNNQEQAELFLQDFLCTQLIGKDILEIWDINDPISILNSLLEKHDHPPSESRLAFESGRNTLEPLFVVALYSSQVFLGKGPGETLSVAEEIAAQDALRRLFNLRMNEAPLPFGKYGGNLCLNTANENEDISNYKSKKLSF